MQSLINLFNGCLKFEIFSYFRFFFKVWSQMRRAQIASTDVKMHNSQISKELGAEWRKMSVEEKAPYVKRVCCCCCSSLSLLNISEN